MALTSVPGAGVTLLSLAQPQLVPGVRKVDEQKQLDEDEEEGAHDAEVEPDCVGKESEARRCGSPGTDMYPSPLTHISSFSHPCPALQALKEAEAASGSASGRSQCGTEWSGAW